MVTTLVDLYVQSSRDALQARRDVVRVAELMGFGSQATTGIATALSEIVRNAITHAHGGRVLAQVAIAHPRTLQLVVRDTDAALDAKPCRGLGLGVAGARRLMDSLDVTREGASTIVTMCKALPASAPDPSNPTLIRAQVIALPPDDPYEALQRRNQSLLRVLDELDEQRRALRRAVTAREKILRIVSHDLRNPLGLIKMSGSLLPRLVAKAAPPERFERVSRTIHDAVLRMERMIADLLDLTAMEQGQLSLTLRRRDVTQAAQETRENTAAAALEAGVSVQVDAPDELYARCDAQRLVQALTNLVGNAIKFSPRGSVATIRVSPGEDAVLFEVIDQGPGIATADRERVFDPYWKGEPTDGGGIGLGLSIAAGIVRAHGGTIGIAGSGGAGTTMMFTVPVDGPVGPEI